MSFEVLVKRVSPTLKRITYKLNGHFSFFNDEDLFQEALVHLWVDFRAGKLNDKTDSYILQGCYFYLKNHLRKTQDKLHLVSIDALVNEDGMDLEETLAAEGPLPAYEELDERLLSEKMQNLGLTPRENDILSLQHERIDRKRNRQKAGDFACNGDQVERKNKR